MFVPYSYLNPHSRSVSPRIGSALEKAFFINFDCSRLSHQRIIVTDNLHEMPAVFQFWIVLSVNLPSTLRPSYSSPHVLPHTQRGSLIACCGCIP